MPLTLSHNDEQVADAVEVSLQGGTIERECPDGICELHTCQSPGSDCGGHTQLVWDREWDEAKAADAVDKALKNTGALAELGRALTGVDENELQLATMGGFKDAFFIILERHGLVDRSEEILDDMAALRADGVRTVFDWIETLK